MEGKQEAKHLCVLDFSSGDAICEKTGCENKLALMMINRNKHRIDENRSSMIALVRENAELFGQNGRLLRFVCEGSEEVIEELFK